MINVLVCGICGKMGKNIVELISEDGDCKVACGVDLHEDLNALPPVYGSFNDIKEKVDVIIDFR